MELDRRSFLACSAAFPGALALSGPKTAPRPPRIPIAVSTYSYWRFRRDSRLQIETCIDLAAEAGFDGVEILHRQMEGEENDYLQGLKRCRSRTYPTRTSSSNAGSSAPTSSIRWTSA